MGRPLRPAETLCCRFPHTPNRHKIGGSPGGIPPKTMWPQSEGHGNQSVTSNRNASDLFACKWLRTPATSKDDGLA